MCACVRVRVRVWWWQEWASRHGHLCVFKSPGCVYTTRWCRSTNMRDGSASRSRAITAAVASRQAGDQASRQAGKQRNHAHTQHVAVRSAPAPHTLRRRAHDAHLLLPSLPSATGRVLLEALVTTRFGLFKGVMEAALGFVSRRRCDAWRSASTRENSPLKWVRISWAVAS